MVNEVKEVVGRIYAIVNSENDEIKYIGQTTQLLKNRWRCHKSGKLQVVDKWVRKYKYIAECIELCVCYSYEEMDEIEIALIALLRKSQTLLNMDNGGNKNKQFSDEHKLNLSISHTGYIQPDDVKNKISKSMMGELNHFYGKKHTEDSLNKLRGRKYTTESKAKMSESAKGRVFSDDTKAKIIKAKSKQMSIISTKSEEIKYFETTTKCKQFLKCDGIDMKKLKNGEIVKGWKLYIPE